MLDADAVINNSSQKVGGSNAYPDPAPKKWVGPDPETPIGSTLLLVYRMRKRRIRAMTSSRTGSRHCVVTRRSAVRRRVPPSPPNAGSSIVDRATTCAMSPAPRSDCNDFNCCTRGSTHSDLEPDLQNILRQSYDYLTVMPKLRSTYDGRLIYKTSNEELKAFLRHDSPAKL